jgi:hypothetical protein
MRGALCPIDAGRTERATQKKSRVDARLCARCGYLP